MHGKFNHARDAPRKTNIELSFVPVTLNSVAAPCVLCVLQVRAIPQVSNLLLLMVVLMFICAIVGMQVSDQRSSSRA